ncbi:MAG: hypothetical protein IPO27_12220 [Bacteroidetes bacterium]|nr:hypothetical protein [Bacteroidota bacterium]
MKKLKSISFVSLVAIIILCTTLALAMFNMNASTSAEESQLPVRAIILAAINVVFFLIVSGTSLSFKKS